MTSRVHGIGARGALVAALWWAILLSPSCDGGEEAKPSPTFEPTPAMEPVATVESGPLYQEAPGEGTFLIDLAAGRWTRVLRSFSELLDDVSPDGETIIYHVIRPDNTSELLAVGIDGSNRRHLADGPLAAFFSPDGETLAMWGPERPLSLMDWPSGEPLAVDLQGQVYSAAWSPQNILAVSTTGESPNERGLHFVSRDGTVRRVEVPTPPIPPLWAPDGSRVAFWTEEIDPRTGNIARTILSTLAPGGQPRVVAQFPGVGGFPGLWIRRASWSADGALLAVTFARPATADPLYEASDILVLDVATGRTRFAVTGAGDSVLSWSPVEPLLLFDGNSCLFEDWQIMLVNGDGSDLRPLTGDQKVNIFGLQAWSPDGRQVATTWAEGRAVTAVDVRTGAKRAVFRTAGVPSSVRWLTPDRLLVTAVVPAGDACVQSLGERSRVVFP